MASYEQEPIYLMTTMIIDAIKENFETLGNNLEQEYKSGLEAAEDKPLFALRFQQKLQDEHMNKLNPVKLLSILHFASSQVKDEKDLKDMADDNGIAFMETMSRAKQMNVEEFSQKVVDDYKQDAAKLDEMVK